jgi:hypothetical protein
MEGEITEALRNRMFRLKLDNGHEMIGYTAGRMKRYRIRMLPAIACGSSFHRTTSIAAASCTACASKRDPWPTESNSCMPSSTPCSLSTSRR